MREGYARIGVWGTVCSLISIRGEISSISVWIESSQPPVQKRPVRVSAKRTRDGEVIRSTKKRGASDSFDTEKQKPIDGTDEGEESLRLRASLIAVREERARTVQGERGMHAPSVLCAPVAVVARER